MGTQYQTLIPGRFAHICDRAVGTDKLFITEKNHQQFLQMLKVELVGIAEVHAYCLLSNHYHLLIRLFDDSNHELFKNALGKIQSKYAKAFNKEHSRKGGLFMRPFKRKIIQDDGHLANIIWYIHRNPMRHRYTNLWQSWPYSSYGIYTKVKPSFVKTADIIAFFGGLDQFIHYHELNSDASLDGASDLHLE